jgi:SAM-dependent methyltransferase
MNINTKEYWENRFNSGSWNKSGQRQTLEYAKANVTNLNIDKNFAGSILDFGCAMGDAISIYNDAFPKAKLSGIDVSGTAIKYCKERWGNLASFYSGDFSNVPAMDIIIASHVMEHITDDRKMIKEMLKKCNELFIFVPYKESPLYHEHVNCYEEDYYNGFNVTDKKIFTVSYRIILPLRSVIKNFIFLRFNIWNNFSKQIIMFHLKGNL